MHAAFLLLQFLIAATPVILVFDGPIVQSLVTATSAAAMAAVVWNIRPGEAGFLWSLVRPLAAAAAVPALWMLFQILPLNVAGFAHPIWESASTALGRSIGGSITIDPGATLLSFGRYLSALAIVFVATAVATDRQRAGQILVALAATATLMAAITIFAPSGDYEFVGNIQTAAISSPVANCVTLGIILSIAAIVRTLALAQSQRLDQRAEGVRFLVTLAINLVAVLLGLISLFKVANIPVIIGAGFGAATLIAALVSRGFRFGPWGYCAIGATVLVALIAVLNFYPVNRGVDATLALATSAPKSWIAVTQHILADGRWTGTGAGTFSNLLPIYRDIDDITPDNSAPTVAATIAIEMGRPMLWAITIISISLIFRLLRGALKRGRDSYYPAAGAGCAVALLLLAFGDAGLFSTAVSIMAAAAMGMAVAQSKSRSV